MKKYENWRKLVVGLEKKIPLPSGKIITPVNFDNAATTPPFVPVLNRVNEFAPWYSSIHRGKGYKSQLSSQLYEESRKTIANFINADINTHSIIYVSNTTEAINKISLKLSQNDNDSIILSSQMEHHSNDLPWRNKFKVDYIKTNKRGELSLKSLESKLIEYGEKVKLVTVSGASNVTGYINPIHQIATMVHSYNTKLLVDGAQLVPHLPVQMIRENTAENIDFLVFSSHKMYAPFGSGVLIAPREELTPGNPASQGGGTVKVVTPTNVQWEDPPHKEEAGSPNIIGIIALIESINTLQKIGMENIINHEKFLLQYTVKKLMQIPEVTLYSNYNNQNILGIIPFNVNNINHDTLATLLANKSGIAVRNGCFCAQPYIQKLLNINPTEIKSHLEHPNQPQPGLVRISYGLYNTPQEIDYFIDQLQNIIQDYTQ